MEVRNDLKVNEVDAKKLAEQLDAAQAILDEIRVTSGCSAIHSPQNPAPERSQKALEAAERILRDRKSRSNFIRPKEIFGEPAWDVLLELFIGETKSEPAWTAIASVAAGSETATITRWLYVLELNGLVMLRTASNDGGPQTIHLTPTGYESMLRYLENIAT